MKDDPQEYTNLAKEPIFKAQLGKMKQFLVEARKVAGNLNETAPHVIESNNAAQEVDRPTA